MKIAIVGPSYPFKSGWAHYNTLLYRELRKRHDVKFIGFRRQYPGILYPGKVDKDYSNTVIKENTENIIDSINPISWIKAAWMINRFKPELIIFHWGTVFWAPLSFVISLLAGGSTKIFICHNVGQHEERFVDRVLTRLGLMNGDGFIVNSKEDERNLKGIFPRKRIELAFHPSYGPLGKGIQKERARKILGIKGKTILFFGIVREYKGLKYLLRAMPMVLKKENVRLVVAGEFWEGKESYEEEIRKMGIEKNVQIVDKFLSSREVSEYISAADIVVLPYISATQSGIVQNSFGLGRPVIVTDVGGLSETVQEGETGFIVRPRDPEGIAEAVLKFYRREDGMENNVRRARKEFSWENLARIIEGFG